MTINNSIPTHRPVRTLPVLLGIVLMPLLLSGTMNAQQAIPPDARIVLITGSTDGLGREVARRLADSGAHVIVHGRNNERGAALVNEIEEKGSGSALFYAADFSSLKDVRQLAADIKRDYSRLDVLVNNAGIWLLRGDRQLSADGHELHFAVNYLAGYLLTNELLPLLEKGRDARIVNVSSVAQQPIDFDDVMLEQGYSGSRGYAQSKLAQVMFTFDLAEQLSRKNIAVHALHPATLMNTAMVSEVGIQARSTVEEGAEAVLHLINGRGLTSGRYYNGKQETRAHAQAYDSQARERLRALSERLAK